MTQHHLFTSQTLDGGFWLCGRCHRIAISPSAFEAAGRNSPPTACIYCSCVYPGCEDEKLASRTLCTTHFAMAEQDRREQELVARDLLLAQPPVPCPDGTPIYDPQLDIYFPSLGDWDDQRNDHYPDQPDRVLLLHPCLVEPAKSPYTLQGLVDSIEEGWSDSGVDLEDNYEMDDKLGEVVALFVRALQKGAPLQWVPQLDKRVEVPAYSREQAPQEQKEQTP